MSNEHVKGLPQLFLPAHKVCGPLPLKGESVNAEGPVDGALHSCLDFAPIHICLEHVARRHVHYRSLSIPKYVVD